MFVQDLMDEQLRQSGCDLVVLSPTPPKQDPSDTAEHRVTSMAINSKATLKEARLHSKQPTQHKLLIMLCVSKILLYAF